MQQPAEIPQGMVPGDVEQQIPMETPMPMERPPIDPRQQRMEMLKQKKQQDALDLLQRSKLPRDSSKFIENRQLVMAKIAHESPGDINRISMF